MTDGSGRIAFPWADGDHEFFLGIDQLRELQEKCSAGPAEIYTRLCTDTWRIEDIAEPIRLGLIGAGMGFSPALALVKRYVHPPIALIDNVKVAALVVLAALAGPENKTVKKKLEAMRGTATPA